MHTMRLDKDIEVWRAALKTAEEQYEACQTRLNALDVERADLLEEMKRLQQAISAITPLASEHPEDVLSKWLTAYTPDPDSGLADAIREVLNTSQRYMTAIEIRDVLEASKYDLTQHSNPLASIHGILKRFEDSGEVSMVAIGSKSSYRIAARKPNFPPPRRRLPNEGVTLTEPLLPMPERRRKNSFQDLAETSRKEEK